MSVEEEVIELVARKTGKSKDKITPEKTFYQLGIDGDDAVELIDAIALKGAFTRSEGRRSSVTGTTSVPSTFLQLRSCQAGIATCHL